jgi:hypothetical protein
MPALLLVQAQQARSSGPLVCAGAVPPAAAASLIQPTALSIRLLRIGALQLRCRHLDMTTGRMLIAGAVSELPRNKMCALHGPTTPGASGHD